jgi:hypothetical protein
MGILNDKVGRERGGFPSCNRLIPEHLEIPRFKTSSSSKARTIFTQRNLVAAMEAGHLSRKYPVRRNKICGAFTNGR